MSNTKPQCRMDVCTRGTFGSNDVCLRHFRMLHFLVDAPTEPVAPHRPALTDRKEAWVDYAVNVLGWDGSVLRESKKDLMTAVVEFEAGRPNVAKQRDTAAEQSPHADAAAVEVDLES